MTAPLQVVQNDRSSSWHTHDQTCHLIREGQPRTLCGQLWRRWFTKPRPALGAATLCGTCEKSARSKGLEIPD
jgi:hypothetical protein